MEKRDAAVVGMACVYPGAGDLQQFWSNVVNGVDVLTHRSHSTIQAGMDALAKDKGEPCRIFLKGGIARYEVPLFPAEYGLKLETNEREGILTILMIAAALADAGIALGDRSRERINVILVKRPNWGPLLERPYTPPSSLGTQDAHILSATPYPLKPLQYADADQLTNLMNIQGKIEVLEQDNGGVFVAMDHGISRLQQELCDAAVIVGINLFGPAAPSVKDFSYISPSQVPRPFDNRADGLVLSEGAGAVVLRKAGCGENRTDRVYAIIKGVGISSAEPGDTNALTTSQRSALKTAYEKSGVHLETIGFLEGQGCGIHKRDISEIEIIKEVFGAHGSPQPALPLSAVSSVIGDAGAAGDMAALIKTVFCLANKVIPPSLNCEEPRPELDGRPFYVTSDSHPWIHDKSLPPRRAAINAFGFDGINVHIILEELSVEESQSQVREILPGLEWETELVVFSAATLIELRDQVLRILVYLEYNRAAYHLKDVAYTQTRHFVPTKPFRLAMVCRNPAQLKRYLEICSRRFRNDVIDFDDVDDIYFTPNSDDSYGKLACVFPGLGGLGFGGPHVQPLKELCLHFPEVRAVFDLVDRRDGNPLDPALTSHLFFPPPYLAPETCKSLLQRLAPPLTGQDKNGEISPGNTLPSFGLAVSNWAYWMLIRELKLAVDMLFGMSVGEVSALCAAGSIDFAELIPSFWQASVANALITDTGYLAFAGTSEDRLRPVLKQFRNVTIAFHIAPDLQIIGGNANQMDRVLQALKSQDVWTQSLPYPPIHTPRFIQMRQMAESFLKAISVHKSRIPIYSGMTAEVLPNDEASIRQALVCNSDHPVMFWQSVKKMYQDGVRIFLQVGSANTLHTQAKTIIGEDDVTALTTDTENLAAIPQLHHLCANLLIKGQKLDLGFLFRHRVARELDYDSATRPGNHQAASQIPKSRSDAPKAPAQHPERSRHISQEIPDSHPAHERRMPFIGRVLDYSPEQQIIVEYILDLAEDLYLSDHLFTYAAGIKPPCACLPIMPITFSMEMMAEVAACLVPGYGHIGFENIRASNWIGLKDVTTLALNVSAELAGENSKFLTRSVNVAVFKEGTTIPAITATVLFGKRYLLSSHWKFESPGDLRPSPITAQNLYKERFLFHGPLLHRISEIVGVGDKNIVGKVTVPSNAGLFRSIANPAFLIPPSFMDGIAQLIVVWLMDKDFRTLPVGIEKIEIYRPAPSVGSHLPVYFQITDISPKTLSADLEIQDGSEMVWMRIKNWRYWIFRCRKKVNDFLRLPQNYFISSAKNLPALPQEAVIQCLSEADLRDLDLEWIARTCLHLDEMPEFERLGIDTVRRRQWLLGRAAAKDAVRLWLARQTTTDLLHPAAFSMAEDSKGELAVKNLVGITEIPKVSLVNSNDSAVAIAHETRLNIDLEHLV